MKIAILGAYKTGTTALFYLLRDALDPPTRTLFEPARYVPASGDERRNVLAKVILGAPGRDWRVDYRSFAEFDKKILLTRDPRDWLISGMLFMIQQVPALYADDRHFKEILAMLRRKESDPGCLSVKAMLMRLLEMRRESSLEAEIEWMRRHLQWLLDFDATLAGHLVFPYEALVDGRFRDLQDYLGVSLSGHANVPTEHDHVTRTKSHGNWRHWFLPEDAALFKPVFEPYIHRYGYSRIWHPASTPRIDPAHGSAYVARTVGKRLSADRDS